VTAPTVTTRTVAPAVAGRAGSPFRLTMRGALILAAVVGIVVVYATDQIVPPTSERSAEIRFWLAARATGMVALVLLAMQVSLGLLLSHPHNKATWRLSRRIFPWHDHLWVFVMAFLVAHVLSIVADPKAGVSVVGAFVPGLSEYRSSPVALGTLALYAFLATALTARYTKLLPAGAWLSLHRLALLVFALTWLHGILAGTDSGALQSGYLAIGGLVVAAGAYRYWASRHARPTFSTSREEVSAP
jgi:methionine sulfoxide reductase heme-binding subunit